MFKVLEFVDDHGNFPYNIMVSYIFKVLEFVDDHGNFPYNMYNDVLRFQGSGVCG